MDTKKWPVLGQVLIGLGVVGGLLNIAAGLNQKNIIAVTGGIIGLIIYWNVYKFKKWALIGLKIMLSLSIAVASLSIRRLPYLILFAVIIYPASLILYFNSVKVKELFHETENNPSGVSKDPA